MTNVLVMIHVFFLLHMYQLTADSPRNVLSTLDLMIVTTYLIFTQPKWSDRSNSLFNSLFGYTY